MKAVIYARYSSDNQREESIEGQLRECTAFAEKNGSTILKHYIDRAYSAKTDNRPEFQRMINDSRQRLFDIVLVWKLDRFARNRYDSANYKNILKKKKRTDIIDIALENYDDIRNNTVKDIKAAYQDLEAKSVKRLEGIFNHQIEVGRNTFVQAKEMMGNYDNETISVTLEKANRTIISASKLLLKYQLPDN